MGDDIRTDLVWLNGENEDDRSRTYLATSLIVICISWDLLLYYSVQVRYVVGQLLLEQFNNEQPLRYLPK
jgi:hypothetical protein